MVSGQGATLGIWTPDLLKTLATGRQVTIFDNRGIGYSNDADPEEENTILGYADSTVDLIDALGLEQPDILGWSLGGFITLTLVTSFPDAVNRVVLADTSAGGQGKCPVLCASEVTDVLTHVYGEALLKCCCILQPKAASSARRVKPMAPYLLAAACPMAPEVWCLSSFVVHELCASLLGKPEHLMRDAILTSRVILQVHLQQALQT